MVLAPITQVGRNYLPYIEHIDGRVIKYIDFVPTSLLPNTTAPGLNSTTDIFITIFDHTGTKEIHKQLPLERLSYVDTLGVRQPINRRVAMDSCFIDCQDQNMVGTTAALVFWYELPQYSQANKSDVVLTDSIEIPITNVVQYNPLPDADRLTGKRFRKILLGIPTVTPNKNSGLGTTELENCFVTLRKGSYRILADVPVKLLYQLQMLEKTEFQNIVFDFDSSFITVGGGGTANPTDYVGKYIFFNLQYEA